VKGGGAKRRCVDAVGIWGQLVNLEKQGGALRLLGAMEKKQSSHEGKGKGGSSWGANWQEPRR